MDYTIIIFVIFGILPSLVWLSYYLSKDLHPEPKKTILRIFLWGALITIPVFFVQIGLNFLLTGKFSANDTPEQYTLHLDITNPTLYVLIYWFAVIAFSEELFKYFVIKVKILNSPDLDEPLDIMLYMVVAALGFAALENVLYLFSPTGQMSFQDLMIRTALIDFVRFIGATFLHTLCSATIGYAVAISLCDEKNRMIEAGFGILAAVVLHGLYDFSIMTLTGYIKFAVPAIIILTLAFLVFTGFEKLKNMKGVTELDIQAIKNNKAEN